MTSSPPLTCPPRFGTKRSPERATLGPAVGVVAAMLGKPLMAWQQYVADVILEIDPITGELAFDEWVLTVPRQSGKSTFVLAKATHRGSATKFFGDRQRIVYTAQTRQKAREKWEEDFVADLQRSRQFRARVTPHRPGGNEHIRFANQSKFGIDANTEKAGHGGTLDEAYIDEAFAQVDNRLEQAFGPAMITRRNKQLGAISTAGWLDASPYLLEKVRIGRRLVADDVRRGTAYFEWSAPDDADPADEDVWLGCMPAVHRPDCGSRCKSHTVRLSAIRAEFEKATRSGKLSDFRRAYLNQWVMKPREAEETAVGDWASCAASLTEAPPVEAVGVAVSVGREWASIGAAAHLADGRPLLAPVDRRADVDWLVDEVPRLQRELGCEVVMDEKGPGGDLIERLERAGARITRANLADYLDACAGLTDRVKAQTVVHSGDADLDAAVKGARWRMVGDRRAFARKTSEGDVSMLEAVTLALWAVDRSTVSVYESRDLATL